ncbi:MAG: xanthine dehydrogenase family protein molybdopterin-binding subunit [Acidimicrobiales bacterium]
MRAAPGTRVARIEDDPLLRGDSRYLNDLDLGQAHVLFVRSSSASARLVRTDTAAAARAPGVIAVATAGQLGLPLIAPGNSFITGVSRPLLAHDVVRYVGEPIVVVVAETMAAATDAAELVEIEYEPLPVSASTRQSLAPDAFVIHPAMSTNVYRIGSHPSAHDVLHDADVVVTGDFVNQRVAASPMEPNGALAIPDDPPGGVTVWASSQFVHGVRREIAEALHLPVEMVRVIHPQVGGGFGPKFETAPEYLVIAALARSLGRALQWHETRSESLVAMPHGRAQSQHAELGLRSDGTCVGLRVRVVGDAGAYPGAGAVSPTGTGVLMVPGPYDIANVDIEVRTVATNTTPVGVYRGPGRAEPNALRERLMDLAAHELGIDPVELRRRNLIRADAMPFTTATGLTYDSGDYRNCLDLAVAQVDYPLLRQQQSERRARRNPLALGIGVALWLDVTPRNRTGEYAALDIEPGPGDSIRINVRAGTCDHGQGHATTWGLILSGILGLPVESVRLVPTDTALVPRGDGTGSARSLQVTGSSLTVAGREVLVQACAVAAHLLEAHPRDIVVTDSGHLAVVGTPTRRVSWLEVLRAAAEPASLPSSVAALVPSGRLGASADIDQDGPTFPYGVHVAVVEVDTETGAVDLVRFVAVDDCGRVINPVVVEGQQHGGIAQGVAQALYEHISYDEHANPLANNFVNYLVPSAADLPGFEVSTSETPTTINILGSKGIGQGGAIGAAPAVQNAVIDALIPFGVRHIDMPLSPQRVYDAITEAR